MNEKNFQFFKAPVTFQKVLALIKKFTQSSLRNQGMWNATTNSPTLIDGTGTKGFYYVVSVAGTQNLGSGSQTFGLGDWVYYNNSNEWKIFKTGVDYVPANKAGDAFSGNISAPKVSAGTTNTPSLETVGEGLTSGPSLAGVVQTARRTTSRVGNAELNFHNHHLHSATSWIKNLFMRSKDDTDTHVSVASGDIIEESIYAGRFQSGGSGAYYPAVSIKKKIGTGTISNTSMPGAISFEVSANGSVSPSEALLIDSDKSLNANGAINEAVFITLATDASGTTDIGAVASNNINLTGSNPITSFGTAPAGTKRRCRVLGSGGSLITYNQASLITVNGKNIATSGNDVFELISLGSGNWLMLSYKTGNGRVLASGSTVLTDAATVAVNLGVADIFELSTTAAVGASRTLGVPTNINKGDKFSLIVRQDSAGSRAMPFAWCYSFPQGITPLLTAFRRAVDFFKGEVISYVPPAAATVTIADPCVVTQTAHGHSDGSVIAFTGTTGALPSGLALNTKYWVGRIDFNTYNLFATKAAAEADTPKIATTGSQSGVHTVTGMQIMMGMNANIS